MIGLGERVPGGWRPQVVRTVAARGEGIGDVLDAVDKHRDWMDAHGELVARRERRAAAEVGAIALGTLRARSFGGTSMAALAARVAAGELDPYAAADELL